MIALVVGGAIGVLLLFLLLWHRKQRSDPSLQLEKAEKELQEGRVAAAQARFLHVVKLVNERQPNSAESSGIRCRARLALGQIEQARGERREAANHYRQAKALGAVLPDSAIFLLAECYADQKETNEEAVGAYLTYLSSGPKSGSAAELVYTAIQNMCLVTDHMKSAERRPRAELNRRVIKASPNLEWAHYFLGLASLLDGRVNEAIEAFVQARKLNPARTLTYYWLGVCHLQLPVPDLDAAIGAIEQFLASPHGDNKNRKREARVCAKIARRIIESVGGFAVARESLNDRSLIALDRAIHYLEISAERQPDDAFHQHDLGRAYRLKGSLEQAIAAFRRAMGLNPGEMQYAYDLGMECLAFGLLSDAIEALERTVQICPNHEDAHGALGEMYFGRGQYEQAIAHLGAALHSRDENPRRLGLLVRSLFALERFVQVAERLDGRKPEDAPLADDKDAEYAAGRSHSALGRFEEALKWLIGLKGRPDATYFIGCAHANLKNFLAARACFDQLIGRGDEWASKAVLQRGHLLQLQGDSKSASEDYRRVVDGDPNCYEALRALGELELEGGDFGAAVSHLTAAIAIRPQSSELHFALGVALERKGDLGEALRSYERVLQGEDSSRALLRVGVVRIRLAEFAEALKVLDVCAGSGDTSDTLLFYRGLACALLGRYQEGIREWSQLRERHPENERLQLNMARARYILGAQYLARGQYEAAIEEWEQYLLQYPMDESVAKDLGEVHFRTALEALQTESHDAVSLARERLQAALQRDPENRMFRYYAALCEANSESDACLPVLRSLAQEGWRTPRVLYHMGWCLLQRGQANAAAEVFHEVQAMPDADAYRDYASWALANTKIEAGNFAEASAILMSAAVPAGAVARELQV